MCTRVSIYLQIAAGEHILKGSDRNDRSTLAAVPTPMVDADGA
jgi:hypothetical protein